MPILPFGHHVSKTYVSKMHDLAPSAKYREGLVKALSGSDAKTTKVFYTNLRSEPHINTPSNLIACALADYESDTSSVCMIENISPEYVKALGSAWNLDPEFFAGHATNPRQEDLWTRWKAPSNPDAVYSSRQYEHLDGVFEYPDIGLPPDESLNSLPNHFHRHCFRKPPYGVQSNTRISYYRIHRLFCKSINHR